MKLLLTRNNQNTTIRLRRLGYALYRNRQGKESFVKRIQGTDFPRFHLYINTEEDNTLICSIHIDQTAPVYTKGNAHRGDYNSPVLEQEINRLQKTNLE